MDAYHIIWGSTLIVFTILIPGLAIAYAIFPKKNQIRIIERIGLGMIFGIIPQLILYTLMKNFGIQLSTTSATLTVLVIVVAGLIIGKKRRI